MQLAEAAYEERLVSALRLCAAGQWGLFGTNDAVIQAHFGAKSPLRSKDALELLERGQEVAGLRQRLGYVDQFPLQKLFLAYRKMASDPNASSEEKLARRLLDEIEKTEDDPKIAWKTLYKDFDEWLVTRFDEWDPLGLLCESNPGSEYAPEVSRIMPLLRTVNSVDELATRVYTIFVEMFDVQSAGMIERYESIARAILDEWQARSAALVQTDVDPK